VEKHESISAAKYQKCTAAVLLCDCLLRYPKYNGKIITFSLPNITKETNV